MPRISVITVVYNASQTLENTLQSVFRQTYQDFEYIIIDGGSTDDTLKIIKRYEDKISKWLSEKDRGVYDAMNKAIKLATGDYVYFLGGDDVLFNDSVFEDFASYLTSTHTIVYGNAKFLSSGKIYDGRFSKLKITTRNICHQAIFYPRSVFQSYQFDIKYRVFADYHLNLRLFGNENYKFKYVPKIVALFNDRGLSGNLTPDAEFTRDLPVLVKENLPWRYYLYRKVRTLAAALKSK